MPPDPDEKLVCAILAEQVAALRERIAGGGAFERLTHCGELLAGLAAGLDPAGDAAAAAAALDNALDDLAFVQAQQQDLARQTAELVVRALTALSEADPAPLSPGGLKSLYVSEEQRRLHEAVLARLAGTLAPKN
jgi:hypothetical protein